MENPDGCSFPGSNPCSISDAKPWLTSLSGDNSGGGEDAKMDEGSSLLSNGSDSEDEDEDEEEEEYNGWPGWENLDPASWIYDDEDKSDPNWMDKIRERSKREADAKYAASKEVEYCVWPEVGSRPRNHEVWDRYLKQIEESEGYDILDFPGVTMLTPIAPILGFPGRTPGPSEYQFLMELAAIAIQKFNEDHHKASPDDHEYEVHELLKANVRPSGMYPTYYLTFQAKEKSPHHIAAEEEDGGLTTFQAMVWKDFSTPAVEVRQCRIKVFKELPSFHTGPAVVTPVPGEGKKL